jgi:hypothetical protein
MTAAWVRRGATALGVARTAIGVVALAAPELVGRPWVGATARGTKGRVLARALGGRDLALGLGTLAALQQLPPTGTAPSDGVAGLWVGMAAMADGLDVLATAIAWDELPAISRWLVAGSAAGAAVVGAAAAWSLLTADDDPLITADSDPLATADDDPVATAGGDPVATAGGDGPASTGDGSPASGDDDRAA